MKVLILLSIFAAAYAVPLSDIEAEPVNVADAPTLNEMLRVAEVKADASDADGELVKFVDGPIFDLGSKIVMVDHFEDGLPDAAPVVAEKVKVSTLPLAYERGDEEKLNIVKFVDSPAEVIQSKPVEGFEKPLPYEMLRNAAAFPKPVWRTFDILPRFDDNETPLTVQVVNANEELADNVFPNVAAEKVMVVDAPALSNSDDVLRTVKFVDEPTNFDNAMM